MSSPATLLCFTLSLLLCWEVSAFRVPFDLGDTQGTWELIKEHGFSQARDLTLENGFSLARDLIKENGFSLASDPDGECDTQPEPTITFEELKLLMVFLISKLDDGVKDILRNTSSPGGAVISIIYKDNVLWTGGYGLKDMKGK